MKVGLILTTINVPTVLSLYRAHDPDVRFFVAMDKKTPEDAFNFCQYDVPNTQVCWVNHEQWKCSPLIGWNTISRRNIAMLEALKWGAEIVISIDDDNLALDAAYFSDFIDRLDPDWAYNGLKANTVTGWVDPGSLCFPVEGKPVTQRGFPHKAASANRFEFVTGARVGVAQGMVLGNSDTSAVDRISRLPQIHQISELLRAGIVTDPRETYAPLNSQNIAFIRELAPCFLMVPQYKRFDDILASLVAQRIMREKQMCVHYGRPLVYQERNEHDLLKDLAAEQWGSERILDFAQWIDGFVLTGMSVCGALKVLYTNLPDWIPRGVQELGLAWIEDVESVL